MIERTIGAGILLHDQQDVSETGLGWRLVCVERLHQVGPVPVVELADSHSPERRPVCVRHCWRIREEPEINWILIQYRAALKTPIWGCGTPIVCQQDAVNLEHPVTSGVFIRPPLSPRGHWHTEIYPDGSSWSVIYMVKQSIWALRLLCPAITFSNVLQVSSAQCLSGLGAGQGALVGVVKLKGRWEKKLDARLKTAAQLRFCNCFAGPCIWFAPPKWNW